MDKKILIAFILIGLTLIIQPVNAVLVRETCLNSTHIALTFDFSITAGGNVTDYTYSQVQRCTNNCSNNKCIGTFPEGDMQQVWFVYVTGAMFLILGTVLGIKRTMNKEVKQGFDSGIIVRYLFFFIGMFILYMAYGMSNNLGNTYGSNAQITGGMNGSGIVILITSMLFVMVFSVEVIVLVLRYMKESGRIKKADDMGEQYGDNTS